jgi:hypothetical protein
MGVSNIICKPALLKPIEVDMSWIMVSAAEADPENPRTLLLQSISKNKGLFRYGCG